MLINAFSDSLQNMVIYVYDGLMFSVKPYQFIHQILPTFLLLKKNQLNALFPYNKL